MPQSVTSGDKWEYARVTRLKRSGFVFQSFILVLALCADTFGAGFAYGTNRIRVGFGKVLFLNGICSVCLGLAMTTGFLPQRGFRGSIFALSAEEALFLWDCFVSRTFLCEDGSGCIGRMDAVSAFLIPVFMCLYGSGVIPWKQMQMALTVWNGRKHLF